MKPIKLIGAGALFLLLGLSLPAFARQDKQDDHGNQDQSAKPQDQSKPAEQNKPAQQQQPAKPSTRQETKPAPQQSTKPVPQQQTKPVKTAAPARQTQQPQQAKQQPQRQSGQHGQPQRTAAQQQTQRSQPAVRVSVRTTTRIPQARFQANFGQGHNFRMGNPHMVGGYSRFSYGGFNFGFVEPWPVGWYYTDDVYIDYVDGEYFLFDPYYPGARVEISVVM
jgi:outer membrane biosynthesis protein TonB